MIMASSLSLGLSKTPNLITTIQFQTHKPTITNKTKAKAKAKAECTSTPPRQIISTKPTLIKKINQLFNNHDHDQNQNQDQISSLAELWREIQGINNWDTLLDPLHPHLRQEILRYGEFAQSCYDSFDFDPDSKYCGTCKYPAGPEFFRLLGAPSLSPYRITRFLYATSHINLPNFFRKPAPSSFWSSPGHANWMGFVAVATDPLEIARLGRRDVVVAWRGTVTYLEWISDLKDILRPPRFGPDDHVKVESGFLDLYTAKQQDHDDGGCSAAAESVSCCCSFSAREQLLAEIKRLVDLYKHEDLSITVTGHSLGSALAILSAYDIAEIGLNDISDAEKIPLTVYSFAGPRVGNLKFKERCDDLGVKVLRIVNVHDVVPTVPGIIANEKVKFQRYIEETMSFPWSYAHVGVELKVDHGHSPFLKASKDLGNAHNLEVHLHLVDGYHGEGKEFSLVNKRDIALVNKNCDLLRGEYGVPPFWRQDENKGMVRNSEGRWVLPERHRLEGHPPDTAEHLDKIIMLLNNNDNNGCRNLGPNLRNMS